MTNSPQKCPICSYENASDAQICVRCGTLLITSNITNQVLSDPPPDRQDAPFALNLPPNTLAFLVEGQKEPRLVQNVEKVLLGRVETIGEMYLLDFTLYGGQFQGVSRRHAIITRNRDSYTLEDENSTNGTWVNQTHLQPHEPHSLKNGDTIRLGRLTFHVYFKTPRVIDEFLFLQKLSPERSLSPGDLETLISPYLVAVSGIQKVVNTLLGEENAIISIQAIEQQDQAIRVRLNGASEAIQFLKTKLHPNGETASVKSEVGARDMKTTPAEDEERVSQLGLALMNEIAPLMQNKLVNVQVYVQQIRPYLKTVTTSQLKILPANKIG